MTGFCTFFHGFAKHFLRVIHTDHIITGLSQKLCHHSGPTAKFQHDPVFNSVFLKTSYKIFRPFFIFHIIHENVVDVSEGPVSTGIISIFHCLKSPFTTFLLQFATRRLSLRSLYVSRPTRRRYPFSEYPGHG